ncbi:hypothetical protein BD769DRAFT_1400660 [Suillus cothurnatus]|nr:hypothetical protein BD769DRAFT_1400660 [Suillus cothurnatus]
MVEPDFPEKIIFLSYVFSEHINRLEMTSHDLPGLQGHFSRGLLNILNTMVEPDFPEKIAFLSYAGFFKCRNRLGMVPEHLEVDGMEICDDENMCGLDCYPCIDHGERSLDMIERFIKDREAAWTAKKVTQGRVNNRKGKKHISNEPGESADITSSHRIHGTSGAKHRAAGNSLEKGRARKRGSLKNSQKAIIEVIAEIQVDAGKSPIDALTPLLPLSWDNMDALTERAFTEGDGVLVSKNLLSWMTERYRILVGIPLNEPLHGQLIPQSPDEYHNLKEDDYLEALGIERLYAALVNAEESPEHLIHLAHALGRIVKDTNTLSDSKPNTRALDPLPPTKLPGKNTPHRQVISTDRYVGVVPALSKSDSLSKSTGIDDHDGSVSSNVCTSNAAAAHPGSAAKTSTSIDDNPMHIDVNNDDSCMMDAEGVRDGDSDKDDSNNSRDDTDGQRKRKSVDWLAQYSPPVQLLLSLNEADINLTIISYQNHDGRSHKKWIKPLDSASSSLAESNSTHTVRTPRAIDLFQWKRVRK